MSPATVEGLLVAALVVVSLGLGTYIVCRDRDRIADMSQQLGVHGLEAGRLIRMIEDMPVAVMTADADDFTITYINTACRRLFERVESLLPVPVDQIVGSTFDIFHRNPRHQHAIMDRLSSLPYTARFTLGEEIVELQVSRISADETELGVMVVWNLVTEAVEAERQILALAQNDALTGLANRSSFREAVQSMLDESKGLTGVLFVDLDGFKAVNDSLGHPVGDDLLTQVADRLVRTCVFPGATIGRLGGDEFGVLLPATDTDFLELAAATVVELLCQPYYVLGGRQVRLGASVGIAVGPLHGTGCEVLLARADIALYSAKAAGKGVAHVFSGDMEERINARTMVEQDLRRALETKADEFFVFYQDIVDIHTGRITTREALARWHHPERGWVSPAEFVPLAEESELIDRLTHLVLMRACFEAGTWDGDIRLAVNISAVQLGTGKLIPIVVKALYDSGLSPDRLELEVTETALLPHSSGALSDLQWLRKLGVHVALDDFGTGHSSLTHIRDFPFDKIKIDGSFVRDAIDNPGCAAVVHAIAEVGRRLGAVIVAEGVETRAHVEIATREGCDEVQGYLFSRPTPSPLDAGTIAELNDPGHPDPVPATQYLATKESHV